MIVTTIADSDRYKGLSENLDRALTWLKTGAYESLPEGRHEIDGDKVFASISSYVTKTYDQCKFETHKAYIDIQLAIEGSEEVEVTTLQGLEVLAPYKPDIAFWTLGKPRNVHKVSLEPGVALILYPEDVHKPCISCGGIQKPIRKVVIKVAV